MDRGQEKCRVTWCMGRRGRRMELGSGLLGMENMGRGPKVVAGSFPPAASFRAFRFASRRIRSFLFR